MLVVGPDLNANEALAWFERAAQRRYPPAQVILAVMYINGWGTRVNYAAALHWLNAAADQLGRPRDLATAAKWYRRAAEVGNPLGENNLADLYLRGEGVKQDDSAAFFWFQKAAQQRHTGACIKLGYMYAEGRGVARSPTRSADLWTRACDGRDALACVELARAYATGRGVRTDRARALALFRKACDAGVATACDPDKATKSDKPAGSGG